MILITSCKFGSLLGALYVVHHYWWIRSEQIKSKFSLLVVKLIDSQNTEIPEVNYQDCEIFANSLWRLLGLYLCQGSIIRSVVHVEHYNKFHQAAPGLSNHIEKNV